MISSDNALNISNGQYKATETTTESELYATVLYMIMSQCVEQTSVRVANYRQLCTVVPVACSEAVLQLYCSRFC